MLPCYHDETQAEAAAQAPGLRLPRGPGSHRHVHRVGHGEPVDRLVDEAQPERPLELHDHGRLVAAHADEIAAGDLALDLVALRLEERLDRRVERGLGLGGGRSAGWAGRRAATCGSAAAVRAVAAGELVERLAAGGGRTLRLPGDPRVDA